MPDGVTSYHAPAGRPAFLGINAKSVDARAAGSKQNRGDSWANRADRYRLQRTAAGLLYRPELDLAEQPHRVTGCSRYLAGNYVGLWRSPDGSRARFTGLTTCGSVWHCPVCAARVAETRRAEIQAGIAEWVKRGGHAYLVTLTFPHTRELDLADALDRQAKALRRWKQCRAYRRILGAGRLGSIRALEVTYGVNGWHPHTHDIVFAQPGLLAGQDVDRPELYHGELAELRDAWIAAVLAVGLADNSQRSDLLAHAFQMQGGERTAEYVAKFGRDEKWGLSRELTGARWKVGARATLAGGVHVTPFQLLAWAADGDALAAGLFRCYAERFAGKRAITWSPGLKTALGVRELDDAEAAELAESSATEFVVALDAEQWRDVIARDARAELLKWCAIYGAEGVAAFMEEVRTRPRTHQGYFRSSTRGRH